MENLLIKKLELATEMLKMSEAVDFSERTKCISKAIDMILDANLLKHRHAEWYDEAAWNNFVKNTEGIVRKNFDIVTIHAMKELSGFEIQWITDDWQSWQQLCILLSEIEFLKETYKDYISEEEFEALEMDSVVDFLKSVNGGGDLPEEYIPESMPESHWWWWYPANEE